jgi:hypothetical protein
MRAGPYRFFIWSNEPPGPAHVHVESGDGHAKFWLDPVSLADSDGYNAREIARIRRLVEAHLEVTLSDGRAVRVPIAWFPRLAAGSPEQRRHWRLIERGVGIRWEELDEDLSVEGLLRA